MAREGQAEALDGVSDEQRQPVVLRAVKRLDQRFGAMAAEIGHKPRERVVVMLVEDRPDAALAADVGE